MRRQKVKAKIGVSLVEVLLVLLLLSAMILPFVLMMTQNTQLSRNVYNQATRSLFLSSANDQMDPNRSDYYQQFDMTTMGTDLNESGQVIPYMNKMDVSNSNSMQQSAYLYSYNTVNDAVSSPRYKVPFFHSSDVFRLRCGNTASLIDTSNQEWVGDGNAYDVTKKQPGYVTGSGGIIGSNVTDIVNTSGTDDGLFQYYREGNASTNIDYKFDVANGDYTVALYFAEITPGVTDTAPNRRLMDIYIEGTLQNSTAYSPYGITGGLYRGNIQAFDITVTDSVLAISIRRNASSNNNARISAIFIKRRFID